MQLRETIRDSTTLTNRYEAQLHAPIRNDNDRSQRNCTIPLHGTALRNRPNAASRHATKLRDTLRNSTDDTLQNPT